MAPVTRSATRAAAAANRPATRSTTRSARATTRQRPSPKTRSKTAPKPIEIFLKKNRVFRNICKQLVLMNNYIRSAKPRYDRAVRENRRSFRLHQRLKIVTLEGVRNVFHQYAIRLADELDELEDRMEARGISLPPHELS